MPNTAVLAALALQAAAAAAPSVSPHDNATLCLDPLGINRGAVCRSFNASRIDAAPDICQCPAATAQVLAPYCGPGERPQADTAAFDAARYAAALRDGSLIGKSFNGRSFCVAHPSPNS